MMHIKQANLIKIGDSFGFTIPKSYIDNGLVSLDKSYSITLKEVGDVKTNSHDDD